MVTNKALASHKHALALVTIGSALRVREMPDCQGILLVDRSWISKQTKVELTDTPAAKSKKQLAIMNALFIECFMRKKQGGCG